MDLVNPDVKHHIQVLSDLFWLNFIRIEAGNLDQNGIEIQTQTGMDKLELARLAIVDRLKLKKP